jgi:DNA-binding Lrp family transcriptional regulator
MSTVAPSKDLSSKQRRILKYLRERADSETYFKSRVIGQDLGLSAKEVGANMRAIRDGEYGIDVSKWGYSSGTTWQVTA